MAINMDFGMTVTQRSDGGGGGGETLPRMRVENGADATSELVSKAAFQNHITTEEEK